MSYHRWAWTLEDPLEELLPEAEDLLPALATSLCGEGGYPALFSLTEGFGFFVTGPGEGLLYYFDRRKETAFLFPRSAE